MLGEPRLTAVIKQPSNVQARLIPMVIQAIQTGKRIQIFPAAKIRFFRRLKYCVQTCLKCWQPHLLDQARGIVRHIESILVGVAFLKSTPRFLGLEPGHEVSAGILGADKSYFWIEQISPAL